MALSKQTDFFGKNAHIIGMARSGMAAAEVLTALGAIVTLHDHKEESEIQESLRIARELGLQTKVGKQAYENLWTADLIVTSPGVPDTCPAIVMGRERGIPIFSEVELGYRISPAPIIAITGTNGKTTTTALTGEILKCDGHHVYVAGNIVAGEIRLPLVRAAYRASASDVIVAEISSFQLEWVSSFRPRVAALLNISADHLDRHPNLQTYAKVKAQIFQYQEPADFAILNADDPIVMQYAPQIKSQIWQFSRTKEVEIGTFTRGTEVWVRTPEGESFVCDTANMRLRGTHNLENVLAAAAAALAFGANRHAVQEAVDAFQPLEHRLEPVAVIKGVEFLNNSMCTNVTAAVRSLEAIGKPTIVIAGGKDKGADYGPLGEAFARYAKHVVLIGQDAPLIEKAARAAGFSQISKAASMDEAVRIAWENAEPGDTIMLSPGCASFDMFRDFEHRGATFKAAVANLAARVEA
ncbi:MAG: UDP-N-acetylmuramoyl-L-alanine--D-glutamate ligase [Armatimonadetes bacterium]|nr:UDP-N-acetylmuramoyl-L-alanine--D-glutamate ligase [Armatimonadota bacterium]